MTHRPKAVLEKVREGVGRQRWAVWTTQASQGDELMMGPRKEGRIDRQRDGTEQGCPQEELKETIGMISEVTQLALSFVLDTGRWFCPNLVFSRN